MPRRATKKRTAPQKAAKTRACRKSAATRPRAQKATNKKAKNKKATNKKASKRTLNAAKPASRQGQKLPKKPAAPPQSSNRGITPLSRALNSLMMRLFSPFQALSHRLMPKGLASARTTRRSRPLSRRAKRSPASGRRQPHTRSTKARFWVFFRQVASFLLLIVIVSVIGLYYYSQSLPPLHAAGIHRPPVVVIVDKNGEEVSREYSTRGESVRLAELPPHVTHAFIATEDRNFYHHMGVNPLSIARAAMANFRNGRITQGGSTITQQLAKNEYLNSERTLKRKIQELLIAIWLETRYSKDEILTHYLDTVYFGAGATGLDAASERYFRKKPYELSVGEAAMLAGLLKAPSKYAPTHNIDAARERAKIVLTSMVKAEYLRPSAAKKITDAAIATVSEEVKSGHYAVDYTMEEYIRLFGPPKSDITIMTTLDLAAQTQLETRAPAVLAADKRVPDQAQLALVAMEHYGAIRVLIGGKDYKTSHFNRASKARRQPGSAFKPFVFLAGIENGFYPDDLVLDQPMQIEGWQPANYKKKYYGTIAAQDALAKSLNAATLYIQETVGRDKVREIAKRAGFKRSLAPGAALGLGVNEVTPLELAGAYGFIANNGVNTHPFIIDTIKSAEGRILFQRDVLANIQAQRNTEEKSIIALNHMLRRVVSHGSGIRARLYPHQAAGKTGTSQNSRDAWFAGHASGLVGVVWIGRDDNKPMSGPHGDVSGAGVPTVIWREMMQIALTGRAPRPVEVYRPPARLPHFMRPFKVLFGSKPPASHRATKIDTVLSEIASSSPEKNPSALSDTPPQTLDDLLHSLEPPSDQKKLEPITEKGIHPVIQGDAPSTPKP